MVRADVLEQGQELGPECGPGVDVGQNGCGKQLSSRHVTGEAELRKMTVESTWPQLGLFDFVTENTRALALR